MRMLLLVFSTFLIALSATANAADSAADFYGNSFICKDASTGAVCDLWLDANGRYAVFYDSGQKAYVKGVQGDFENEGRTGTYTATPTAAGLKVCVKPDIDRPPRPRGHSPALFREASCTTLPAHQLGEIWTLAHDGHTYRVALIPGR